MDLDLEGHEVVGRGTRAEDALRLVEATSPDVLVIDHRMPPGLTGTEVAAIMAESHPDVSVIVYTNYQDPEVIAAVQDAGAQYVPKGNLRTLRRAVVGT